MNKLLSVLAAGLLATSSVAVSAEGASGTEKPGAMAGELISLTATVEAIDLEKRLVTLKGPEGNTVTLEVGEQARNLSQVKVGDQVQADYYESVALYAQKPDGSLPAAAEMAAVERAPAGEKPGIAAVDSRIITATVESIDLEKRTVALWRWPCESRRRVSTGVCRYLQSPTSEWRGWISKTSAGAVSSGVSPASG